MPVKYLPVVLWVLAWQVPLPISSASAASEAPPADHGQHAVAFDDYRMNIQDGVTADAYNLVPLTEHDGARTQSMIDGIAGRGPTRSATADANDEPRLLRSDLLPRPATIALWVAGLMAVVLMVIRRRR